MTEQGSGYLSRPSPSGPELLTLDARVTVASIDTYLRFAEATNRLDLHDQGGESPIDLFTEASGEVIENVASNVVEHKVENAVGSVTGAAEQVGETVAGVARKVTDQAGDIVEKIRPDG